jgi:IrrE N-terminal-like domain
MAVSADSRPHFTTIAHFVSSSPDEIGALFREALTFGQDAIYVDSEQMERYPNRYRFTLAHEVGHKLIHSEMYVEAGVTDLDGYLDFLANMDETVRSKFEWQAQNLAGRILLPTEAFLSSCREAMAPFRVKVGGIADQDAICDFFSRHVASDFEVSHYVVKKRLWSDGLWPQVYD